MQATTRRARCPAPARGPVLIASGQLGALRDRDGKAGLEPKKRGPKAKAKADDKDRRIVELERELAKTKARAERAEFLVDMQKWPSFSAARARRSRPSVIALVSLAATVVGERQASRQG